MNDTHLFPRSAALPLQDGDLLLLMGAGDIGAAAQAIATQGFEGATK